MTTCRRRETVKPCAFDQLRGGPVDRAAAARVPERRTRRQRRVPARGRPAQRRRRVARALRDPRGGGAGRRRRHAHRRTAAERGVGLAAAGRARIRSPSPVPPINPDDARRPGAHRPARAARPRSSRQTPTCRSRSLRAPRPSTPGARWRRSSRMLAAGPPALRSTTGRNQVLAGPFVPLDLPSLERGGLQDLATSNSPTGTSELTRGVSALETFLGAPMTTRAPRSPGHSTRPSLCAPAERQRAPTRGRRRRAHAGRPRSSRPRIRTRCRQSPGDDSSAATVARHRHRLRAVPHRRRAARAARRAPPRRARARRRRATEHPARRRHHQPGRLGRQRHVRRRGAGRAARQPARPSDDRRRHSSQAVPVATGRRPARRCAGVPPARAVLTARAAGHGLAVRQRRDEPRPRWPQVVRAGRPSASPAPTARWRRRWRRRGRHPAGRQAARSCSRRSAPRSTATSARSRCSRGSTVTITSSKAEIPISFKNNERPDQVTVHLRLESDRLLFPDGAERDVTLPPKRNTTVRVAVETRGSGTVAGAHDRHDARRARRSASDDDQGPLDLRERCGSLPDRGCDRVPRDLVGLGHPPSAQEARANSTPRTDWRRPPDNRRDQAPATRVRRPGAHAAVRRGRRLVRATSGHRRAGIQPDGVGDLARPLERGRRGRHGALARHRVRAHRRHRVRARRDDARRHLQLRQRDPEHRLRAAARRRAHRDARAAVRAVLRDRTTTTRRARSSPSRSLALARDHRGRHPRRAVDRRPLHAQRARARTSPNSRSSPPTSCGCSCRRCSSTASSRSRPRCSTRDAASSPPRSRRSSTTSS